MAERLTKKISKTIQDKYSLGQYLYYDFAGLDDTNKLLNKLGKLEDILEKYDLEVEELDDRIHNGAFNYIDKLKAETDRDTWKRACELACDVLRDINYKIYNEDRIDFENIFYQQVTGKLPAQAKKEGDSI